MDLPLMLKLRERNYFCCFKTKIYEGRTDLSRKMMYSGASIQGIPSGPKQVSR